MEYIRNCAEGFYREIRKVAIYTAPDLNYEDQFYGAFPELDDAVYVIDVVPERYNRRLNTRQQDGNYFVDINLSFPLLDLSPSLIADLSESLNKKGFAVVLISNTERVMLGNDREPLRIDFLDAKQDNNSGNDSYSIAVTGESVIIPAPSPI